jgi:TrmH family RNA methyltransferase
MTFRIVQSKQNSRVKELRAAFLRPGKSEGGVVALEGLHLIEEAVRSGVEVIVVFVAQGHEKLADDLGLAESVEVLLLPKEILDGAVSTESPQPIAALVRVRIWDWSALIVGDAAPLILVLAGIQDPGNLGTILRSGEAFGATGVVSLPGTVSRWNAKALRASAGSVFRVPVVSVTEDECFKSLRKAGVMALATLPLNAKGPEQFDLGKAMAFVVGSEGGGLAPALVERCNARVTIPCPGSVESLNAAVATSVLLYEASRQRAR